MPKLVIVPTPVGNLQDITPRALQAFRDAELVLCEDTRVTQKLLQHFEITGKRLFSYHLANEHKVLSQVVALVAQSGMVALASDAGTPGISDPGFLLIRECIQLGIEVETLPGATAFVPALVSGGLPCDRFFFEGFLPPQKGRKTRLEFLAQIPATVIIYESPYKIMKLLDEAISIFGESRPASLSREISKVYEEHMRGTLVEIKTMMATKTSIKGEFVLCIGILKPEKHRTEEE